MAGGSNEIHRQPLGRALALASKTVSRAFTEHLVAAGGSAPVWLVLLELKRGRWRTQQQTAHALGLEGPTLTHHLDRMEKTGLISRTRDPEDRRVVRLELTPAGEELFGRLVAAAGEFDDRLRAGISDKEIDQVRDVLARLVENVSDG